jgi:S-formylglutathione hydrolase FrmB
MSVSEKRGHVIALHHTSKVLQGNALGDPHERDVYCYVPPDYDASGARYPVVYFLSGFTGTGRMHLNFDPFVESIDRRLDRLITGGAMPPVICVLPDCMTSLGGSQYVNSSATGRYEDHLVEEIVPFVDERLRTLGSRDHRGLTGKSSGGYGAMVVPMLRPDVFGGLATHAGDALFELCYLPEFPDTVRALRDEYDGSYDAFWEDFHSRPALTKKSDIVLVNTYAMAACYSANEDGSVDLPFDTATGMLRDDVWQRWLAWDPVRMARRHADALRSQRAIYIDAGTRDEWFLDLGAEAFRRELEALGITDVFFELFDAGHGGIEYRYPLAIRYLAERLQ